jgi:mercuric transport protein
MRKLMISAVTLAVIISILITGFDVSNSSSKESKNTQEVTFKIDGMMCKMCPLTIKTALNKIDGVVNAEVSYNNKEAIVQYEEDKVTESDMVKAIENAGKYHVTKFD